MRVLILSQHFPPEVTASRFRVEAFTRALIEDGHDVHVVCAVPNHPLGVIDAAFRGRLIARKRRGRLRVTYVWVSTKQTKSFLSRLANYASYAFMSTLVGVLDERPDVVLATSPPLPVGAAGVAVAARHRVPWVFDARDLWPKAAVVLGELNGERAIQAAELLERWLYSEADLIVTVTEPFRRHIQSLAPPETPVELLPNGTTQRWLEAGEGEPDRAALGIPQDRFVLAYAGNLGLYHALDVAIEAAELLDDSFELLLIGHGPLRSQLERRAAELPPGRVRFAGLMAPEDAAKHLRAADALLVSLHASLTDVLSSKLFDYCAIGRPVIVAAAGETRRVVEEADAAYVVPPESPAEIAGAVRALRADPELQARLAASGRHLATEYLRERQASRMISLLESAGRGVPD